MAQIINTATIGKYQYNVGDTIKVIATPIFDTVTNTVTDTIVDFQKVCNPHFSDVNQEITITYTATNNTAAATPVFSNIAVQDDILISNPYIVILNTNNVLNYIVTAGRFDMDLAQVSGGLGPGESVTATVTLKLLPGADLTYNYNTIATAFFTEPTTGSTNDLTDACNLQIQNGTLTIDKASSVPEGTPVACGQVLTYTITIRNTGNVEATILAGDFTDPLPHGVAYAESLSPATFTFNGSAVTNTTSIVIPPQTNFVVVYNVTVQCPTF